MVPIFQLFGFSTASDLGTNSNQSGSHYFIKAGTILKEMNYKTS